jgi:hypothetical protein
MLGGVDVIVFLMGFNCERDSLSAKGCLEKKKVVLDFFLNFKFEI